MQGQNLRGLEDLHKRVECESCGQSKHNFKRTVRVNTKANPVYNYKIKEDCVKQKLIGTNQVLLAYSYTII